MSAVFAGLRPTPPGEARRTATPGDDARVVAEYLDSLGIPINQIEGFAVAARAGERLRVTLTLVVQRSGNDPAAQ